MFLPQLVQNIRCVESGIVTQLAGNDFQCLRHGSDDQLFLASDRSAGNLIDHKLFPMTEPPN